MDSSTFKRSSSTNIHTPTASPLHTTSAAPSLASSSSNPHLSMHNVEVEVKPWDGQVFLSHTSEIVCKLLYKKFYRHPDCTILYGKWSTVLVEQQRHQRDPSGVSQAKIVFKEDSSLQESGQEHSFASSQSSSPDVPPRTRKTRPISGPSPLRYNESTIPLSLVTRQ
jgi:hypothetical protein